MLHLKNISKIYETADFKQAALDGVSVSFNKGEFVSILGPSGSGKTTLLNIIGGLDQYSDGDLIISGTSTKKFKSSDWDAYRNNSVGFVFQSYNLIGHISVLENVEMAMTLSGVSKKERRESAMKALERVGLKDHVHKSPNQLSGGQKQRVAIARAISNNPEIILADEPTGALDSHTSAEVMELLKEIADDKLVIMVTHNSKLAQTYSNRIVQLRDGLIESDSQSVVDQSVEDHYEPRKTSMNLGTAIKLSFNNLKTKFKRTAITSFAGSIGIVGVALVLSISNGMNTEISSMEQEQLASMPITINESPTTLQIGPPERTGEEAEVFDVDYIIPYDSSKKQDAHKNILTEDFINVVNSMDKNLYETIQYQMALELNILVKQENGIIEPVNMEQKTGSGFRVQSGKVFNELPDNQGLIEEQYEILSGKMPETLNEIILVIEEDNQMDQSILQAMGVSPNESIEYEELIGKEYVVAMNDNFYIEEGVSKGFSMSSNLEDVYNKGIKLSIVGILKPSSPLETDDEVSNQVNILSAGVYYTNALTKDILDRSMDSNIVRAQMSSEVDILTGMPFNEFYSKNDSLKKLGGVSTPTGISIYPKDYTTKTEIKDYFDLWNEGKVAEDIIIYTDLSEQISGSITTMIDMIEMVLVAFAAISLIVSAIMIGIITYVSVLERTKEIGVLRSLGASKKDIKNVFYAETAIVGFVAGALGVLSTLILSVPISKVLEKAMDISNIVQVSLVQSILLIVISMGLTMFSGLIPASIAAKKNPVEALRSE